MVILLYKWSILISCLLSAGNADSNRAVRHPLFVSVTEINYNATDKNLEISCKIFTDDFEKTLAKNYQASVDLAKPHDSAAVNRMVETYIRNHLQLRVDGQPVQLEFLGYEKENDACWSYLQAGYKTTPHTIEVMNNLLYDSFDKQINLMHVRVNGKRKSSRLDYPEKIAKFEF